jgi:tetratricopeptide (TPR) repeat protein
LSRRHHDLHGESLTLDSLGYLAQHTNQHDQAVEFYRMALATLREVGNSYHEADTLDKLADVRTALGQFSEARDAWQQALQLYQAQDRPLDADRVRQKLAAHHHERSVCSADPG